MSETPATASHPPHGAPAYLQLPSSDVAASARFYGSVFGWSTDAEWAAFEAPGLIGQWVLDREPSSTSGPVVWLAVASLGAALQAVEEHGGQVLAPPVLDQGARWLAEVLDPSGNRVGIVSAAGPVRSQTLVSVADVEASSRWYVEVLGLRSDHGGPEYERLLTADGTLVLQLHRFDVDHHHGHIGAPGAEGVLLWFGEVSDLDGCVARAESLGSPVVLEPHRNPPVGQGNGPAHREVWLRDPDGYVVVLAGPDGSAYEPA
jgi:predicted enzyme related to lactoylglutathione lyase